MHHVALEHYAHSFPPAQLWPKIHHKKAPARTKQGRITRVPYAHHGPAKAAPNLTVDLETAIGRQPRRKAVRVASGL